MIGKWSNYNCSICFLEQRYFGCKKAFFALKNAKKKPFLQKNGSFCQIMAILPPHTDFELEH